MTEIGLQPTLARRGRVGMACLAGFLCVPLALATLGSREPQLDTIFSDKRNLLQKQSLNIDCVFLGSSRYYRHIDPTVVDGHWTTGRSGSSFNLGIPALTLVEQASVLNSPDLRALPRLRVVVFEPILSASLELRNLSTARSIAAHSPSGTWSLLRHLAASASPPRRRLWYAGLHLAALGLHLFWIPGLEGLAERPSVSYLPEDQAGFLASGDGSEPETDDPARRFLRPAFFDAAVAAREAFRESGPLLPAAHIEPILKRAAEVRSIGAQPVLVVTPRLDWDVRDGRPVIERSFLNALHRSLRTLDLPYLAYDDDPDFLRVELWHDGGHMNADGARLFSERLGRDLDRLARSRQ